MKKLYTFLVFGLASVAAFAQSKQNVTFKVDMNNYSATSYSAVYVNGSYNGWCGTCNPLTDTDQDGVWEGTFEITADSIEYKFTLDGWNGQENLTSGTTCTKTTSGFTNRFVKLNGDVTLDKVCWNSCDACVKVTKKTIVFNVNMKQYDKSYSKVYVTGTFNGWSGNANEMTDADGDKIYSDTIELTDDSIEYKFQVDEWKDDEKLTSGSSCTKTTSGFTNRFAKLTGNKVFSNVCWASCSECTNDVTFKVDMNKYKGTSFTGVYVNGNFNGWCGSCNPLTDDDKDGIWEVKLPITQDSIEFKYTLDGWNGQESLQEGTSCTKTTSGFTNRFLKITSATVLDVVCWESCVSCANTKEKANVTFQVDIRGFGGSYSTVNLNGTFNGWCGSCIAMTDDNKDSIYTVTVPLFAGDTIEYKFTADGWANDEKFVGGEPCTKTTGGFTNRYNVVTGDTTYPVVCWAKCTTCLTNNATELVAGSLNVYPNPTEGILYFNSNASVSKANVFDLSGKLLLSERFNGNSNNNQLNLNGFTNGLYILSVETANGTINKQFSINK
jgi:1,4-alpha-glucan branching enzyme